MTGPPPPGAPREALRQADGTWMVTRHAEARLALNDARFSADPAEPRPEASPAAASQHLVDRLRGHWWTFTDPPEHTRLRRIIKPLFDARVRRVGPVIDAVLGDILERAAAAGSLRVADELAMHLPAAVTADLLGLPADAARFARWLYEPDTIFGTHPRPSREGLARAADILGYFAGLIEARERAPGDDLISDLCRARAAGAPIGEEELIASAAMLLIGGVSTLHNFFVSAVASLVRAPAALARLRHGGASPATLAEEILRTCQVLPRIRRRTLEPVRLGEAEIPSNALVFIDLNAANYDPAAFAEPARFDPERDPNPHLAFGFGTHHCIGAALARLQVEVLLRRLASEAPGLAAADEAGRALVRDFACPKDLRVRW